MKNFVFCERFKNELEESELTQNDIARRCGIDSSCITQYKQGKSMPSIKTLFELCSVLDVSADYLLGLSDRKSILY